MIGVMVDYDRVKWYENMIKKMQSFDKIYLIYFCLLPLLCDYKGKTFGCLLNSLNSKGKQVS